jgi:hypothetical protein
VLRAGEIRCGAQIFSVASTNGAMPGPRVTALVPSDAISIAPVAGNPANAVVGTLTSVLRLGDLTGLTLAFEGGELRFRVPTREADARRLQGGAALTVEVDPALIYVLRED